MTPQTDKDDHSPELRAGFQTWLNSNGHGFQQRVLAECNGIRAFGPDEGIWRLLGTEVPLEHRGEDLHIDGVLEFQSSFNAGQQFAVVEAKRANPALSSWCFAARETQPIRQYVDRYAMVDGRLLAHVHHMSGGQTPVAHIGRELKSRGAKGDPIGGRALDEAVAQVLRGTAAFADNIERWMTDTSAWIQPVIFTTATLYMTTTPLSRADLITGNLEVQDLVAVPWLWLQTHVSPSLAPQVERPVRFRWSRTVKSDLIRVSRRSIAIVNAAHITDGLNGLAGVSIDPVLQPS